MVLAAVLVACGEQSTGPGDSPLGSPIDSPIDRPGENEIAGYVDLVDALRAAGASVEPAGEIEQPFFSVAGMSIKVNDADVQVFEYADEATRRAASEGIAPDGFTIGTTIISWIDQPNFWARGRVIVLYVGQEQVILELLDRVLGQPITQRADVPHLDSPEAVGAAQQELSELLEVPVQQIDPVSVEQVEWSDACLGLAQADELCAQVITPGWLIVLAAEGERFEVHSDQSGEILRWREPLGSAGRVCTEIGCFDGLTVQLQGSIPAAFSVEATAPGGETTVVVCPEGGAGVVCGVDQLVFEGFTREEVTITISWDGGSLTETFRPAYETFRPNGPDCPPECRQAEITMRLGE
jgi:hypothetical protein